jgi:hypothetical protein
VKSGSHGGTYATEVKRRLEGLIALLRTSYPWGWLAEVDGDADGREDQRAVGELVFVAVGRGPSGTPRAGSGMARTSGGIGMMPGPR